VTCQIPDEDEVTAAIAGVPAGTNFVCVAFEKDSALQCLKWYSTNGILVTRLHPAQSIGSFRDEPDFLSHVVWQPGDRYGVVTRDNNDVWRVTWFGPEVLQGRYARFEMTGKAAVPLTPKQLTALGLDKVRPHRFEQPPK
jgi:hypothetical protein